MKKKKIVKQNALKLGNGNQTTRVVQIKGESSPYKNTKAVNSSNISQNSHQVKKET